MVDQEWLCFEKLPLRNSYTLYIKVRHFTVGTRIKSELCTKPFMMKKLRIIFDMRLIHAVEVLLAFELSYLQIRNAYQLFWYKKACLYCRSILIQLTISPSQVMWIFIVD